MRNYRRVGTVFIGAALVAWGTTRPRPDRTAAAGAADYGAAGQEVDCAAQLLPALARLEAKERVVRALLAGEGTLLEAAARFRELDAVEPRMRPECDPRVYAGDAEAERYCRAVLFWANTPGGESAERSAAVRRLEDELEGHRLCRTLELPPPRRPAVYPETPADE
jgi:hypothetical protein